MYVVLKSKCLVHFTTVHADTSVMVLWRRLQFAFCHLKKKNPSFQFEDDVALVSPFPLTLFPVVTVGWGREGVASTSRLCLLSVVRETHCGEGSPPPGSPWASQWKRRLLHWLPPFSLFFFHYLECFGFPRCVCCGVLLPEVKHYVSPFQTTH